jgi:hypothetical protein
MPNAPALFIHFPNAVKRHTMNPALHTFKVAQLEVPTAKFGVPADTVQQFVNGDHREDRSVKYNNLVQKNLEAATALLRDLDRQAVFGFCFSALPAVAAEEIAGQGICYYLRRSKALEILAGQ